MIIELLGHKDYLRILLALREHKGLRFSEIQRVLKLNPAQVDRAMRFLRTGLWVIPRTVPTKGDRILVKYDLGKRGESFLKVFDSLNNAIQRNVGALGFSEVQEVQSLYLKGQAWH